MGFTCSASFRFHENQFTGLHDYEARSLMKSGLTKGIFERSNGEALNPNAIEYYSQLLESWFIEG